MNRKNLLGACAFGSIAIAGSAAADTLADDAPIATNRTAHGAPEVNGMSPGMFSRFSEHDRIPVDVHEGPWVALVEAGLNYIKRETPRGTDTKTVPFLRAKTGVALPLGIKAYGDVTATREAVLYESVIDQGMTQNSLNSMVRQPLYAFEVPGTKTLKSRSALIVDQAVLETDVAGVTVQAGIIAPADRMASATARMPGAEKVLRNLPPQALIEPKPLGVIVSKRVFSTSRLGIVARFMAAEVMARNAAPLDLAVKGGALPVHSERDDQGQDYVAYTEPAHQTDLGYTYGAELRGVYSFSSNLQAEASIASVEANGKTKRKPFKTPFAGSAVLRWRGQEGDVSLVAQGGLGYQKNHRDFYGNIIDTTSLTTAAFVEASQGRWSVRAGFGRNELKGTGRLGQDGARYAWQATLGYRLKEDVMLKVYTARRRTSETDAGALVAATDTYEREPDATMVGTALRLRF